ncbi:MAG: hypothetical protein WDO24_13655 [Pseudomonadota bacterium]
MLNAEPDSFAHSYFLVHGPSVCAIGLRTADELQAMSAPRPSAAPASRDGSGPTSA